MTDVDQTTQLASPAPAKKRKQQHNTAQDDLILLRRERVATLRNRRMTQREIQSTLATRYKDITTLEPNPFFMLNSDTKQPYDLATINRDLKWLRAHDLKNAERETRDFRGQQLAEINEVKRAAWGVKDLDTVGKMIALEAKITGTIIEKRELSGLDGKPIQVEVKVDDLADVFKQMAAYDKEQKQKQKV